MMRMNLPKLSSPPTRRPARRAAQGFTLIAILVMMVVLAFISLAAVSTSIVLADDQAVVRTGLATILAPHDDLVVVGEAEDGLEAVRSVRGWSVGDEPPGERP